jgi:hypothetical protein
MTLSMPHIPQVSRPDFVRCAFRLEWITAGRMLVEAAVAIGSGIAARSLSLIAFGADSLRTCLCRCPAVANSCLDAPGAEFPESVEHWAGRIGRVLFCALAVYVAISAVYGLWMREGQEFSTSGLALAVLTIPVRSRSLALC